MYAFLCFAGLAGEVWMLAAGFDFIRILLLHSAVCLVLLWARNLSSRDVEKGLEKYIVFMMPVLGLAVHLLVELYYKFLKIEEDSIEQYEEYLKYMDMMNLHRDIDVEKEVNTLSLYDRLSHSPSSEKKMAIMGINTKDMQVKTHVLRKALLDEDPEVVHYAASMLGFLQERHEKKLLEMEKEYDMDKTQSRLYSIVMEHKRYLDSGFIDHISKEVYEKRYVDLLDKLDKSGSESFEIKLMIAREYIKRDILDRAGDILEKLQQKHFERCEVYIAYMKLFYRKGDYESVRRVAHKLQRMNMNVPEEEMDMVEFWM